MTASPRRFPLSSTHNRKRRSVHPFQEKQSSHNPSSSVVTKPIMETILSPSTENSIVSGPLMETHQDKPLCTSATTPQQQSLVDVFRSSVWIDAESDDEEGWTLKRASPVYDSDDEFYQYESPSKRKKTVSLDWESRLSDEIPILLSQDDAISSQSTL